MSKVMKANEAPEKIWVHELSAKELNVPLKEYHIEYTRTDAFIEKACKYLYDYNQNIVKKHGAKALLGCSEYTINVDEFRKYMEGE